MDDPSTASSHGLSGHAIDGCSLKCAFSEKRFYGHGLHQSFQVAFKWDFVLEDVLEWNLLRLV